MKAKKRILAFLFSVLMVWQGYSLARAEGEIPSFVSEKHTDSTEMENSTNELSSTVEENKALYITAPEESAVAVTDMANATNEFRSVPESESPLLEGNEQEEDNSYAYPSAQGFSKSVRGEVQEITDDGGNFHYIMEYVVRFDAKSFEGTHNENGYDSVQFVDRLGANNFGYFMPYSFYSGYSIDGSLYQPVLRRGVWRSGEWKVAQNGKKYFVPAADDANPGSIYSLRSDAEGLKPAEEETIYPDFVHNGKDNPVGFTCNLDHIAPNEGFELRYFVELHEFPENGSSYNNLAKLVGIDTKEINSTYTVKQNLNAFQGKKHSIRIKKTDKASGEALPDAEFMLTKKYSNYNKMVTTWYDGEVSIDNLTDGEYEIVEVDPPFGYKLDKTAHNVTITETDNKTEYPLDLTNKKINPNTRDIIVEKKWAVTVKPGTPSPASLLDDYFSGRLPLFDDSLHDGLLRDSADSHDDLSVDRENNPLAAVSALDVLMDNFTSDTSRVKVYLLMNGKKKEELSAILSDDNDWHHTFEEMPRKDENGKDIVYSVKEEPVKGYKAAISGTQDTKFTITNYYDEDDSFVIPVTKVWKGKGKRPKEIVVELWGNGSYLDSATLSAVNDWQHNFFVLKEKNGEKIKYQVKEVKVEGYDTAIENLLDSGRGFIITNTRNTPPEEENTPEPPKGNDNPPTPGGNENTPPKPNDNGGNPPTPSRGGNTPGNPGGGGSTPPRVVERPPIGVTTPPPSTIETPGEVLGANRTTPSNITEPSPQVLGADRVKKTLRQGRGWTKTSDNGAVYLYLSFFLLSLTALSFVLIQKKRNKESKR